MPVNAADMHICWPNSIRDQEVYSALIVSLQGVQNSLELKHNCLLGSRDLKHRINGTRSSLRETKTRRRYCRISLSM